MESWVWITRWFLICVRYSRLYLIYHKKDESLTAIPPIHIDINRINNRLALKIKKGYKLELQTPETIKFIGSTKNLIDKAKNGENVQSLEVVEVDLVQCNSVDNRHQQKSDLLYTFTLNKSHGYLLIFEPSNFVFLKIYNTNYHNIYKSKW